MEESRLVQMFKRFVGEVEGLDIEEKDKCSLIVQASNLITETQLCATKDDVREMLSVADKYALKSAKLKGDVMSYIMLSMMGVNDED